MNYLNRSKILNQYQTGFRKYHSTQSALLKLMDDIRAGKDRKLATLLLQFDFSKVFDTISPSKLLAKLGKFGFSRSALRWFWSYLTGRSQWVFSHLSASAYCETNLEVPQGWVLGPLLSGHETALCRWATDIYIQMPATKSEIEMGVWMLSDFAQLVAE